MEFSGSYCRKEEAPSLFLSSPFCRRQEFTAAADLELLVFWPPLPKHWDYNCGLILPVYAVLGLRALGKPSTNPATGPAWEKPFPWDHHAFLSPPLPGPQTPEGKKPQSTHSPEAWDPGSS